MTPAQRNDACAVCHAKAMVLSDSFPPGARLHDYFGLDWTLLWKTITEDLPRLSNHVSQILAVEFPDE